MGQKDKIQMIKEFIGNLGAPSIAQPQDDDDEELNEIEARHSGIMSQIPSLLEIYLGEK